MDYLSLIRQPIKGELNNFIELFHQSLNHDDDLLGKALSHIRQRGGKRMRPMLTLLMAKNFGIVNEVTQYASVGLELLHTASLVHDDVVDESDERRGQASVNASYNNKVAVLVGDYILSTSLLYVSYTHNSSIVKYLSELGTVTVRTAEAVILAFMGICIFFNLYLSVAVASDRQVNIFPNFLSSSRSFFLAEKSLDSTVPLEHFIISAISETDFSS